MNKEATNIFTPPLIYNPNFIVSAGAYPVPLPPGCDPQRMRSVSGADTSQQSFLPMPRLIPALVFEGTWLAAEYGRGKTYLP